MTCWKNRSTKEGSNSGQKEETLAVDLRGGGGGERLPEERGRWVGFSRRKEGTAAGGKTLS